MILGAGAIILAALVLYGARLRLFMPPVREHSREREIARYSTPFSSRDPERLHNIRVTVDRLSRLAVEPGEVFSLKSVVYAPGMEKLYKRAPVMDDNGKMVEELGGGICQVSTTLYNAALSCGLEIVEVHRHARPVNYVPRGHDATLYEDQDLKIRNTRLQPIVFRGEVEEDRLTIRILERAAPLR